MTELENKFLNKRVVVSDVTFHNSGKVEDVEGICTFIGVNKVMGWKQVTIGRMPITLDSYSQVELETNKYREK